MSTSHLDFGLLPFAIYPIYRSVATRTHKPSILDSTSWPWHEWGDDMLVVNVVEAKEMRDKMRDFKQTIFTQLKLSVEFSQASHIPPLLLFEEQRRISIFLNEKCVHLMGHVSKNIQKSHAMFSLKKNFSNLPEESPFLAEGYSFWFGRCSFWFQERQAKLRRVSNLVCERNSLIYGVPCLTRKWWKKISSKGRCNQ